MSSAKRKSQQSSTDRGTSTECKSYSLPPSIKRYHGSFKTVDDVNTEYWDNTKPNLRDEEILLAWCDEPDYDMSCYVLFQRDGKLYENSSSHCSCNGFTWEPEETSVKALRHRLEKGTFYYSRSLAPIVEIILSVLNGG